LAADHNDEGRIGEAEGVSYYQVGSGANGLIILPDIWGWNGGRTRAIADDFAKRGDLSVWVPKILEAVEGGTDGDGLPPNFAFMERRGEITPKNFVGPWCPENVLPMVEKLITAMKAAGVRRYGYLGFCYGGWIGMHLSAKISGSELVCGAIPHPSISLEGFFERNPADLGAKVQCPVAFFPAGKPDGPGGDPEIYNKDGSLYLALEKKFPGKNFTMRFEDEIHGFVARGAIKDGQFKAGDGQTTKENVEKCVREIEKFFERHALWKDVVEMKVSTKKPVSFYVKSANAFLSGVEAKEATDDKEAQEAKPPISTLKISGLGDAINTAVAAATRAEAEGVGTITKVETSYPEMTSGRGCAQVMITVKRKQ